MSTSTLSELNATAGVAMSRAPLANVVNRWPMAATVLIACIFAFLMQVVFKNDRWPGIPMVGTEYGGSGSRRRRFLNGGAKSLYLNGYRKVRQIDELAVGRMSN